MPDEGTLFMPVSIDVTAAQQDEIVRPYAPDFKDTEKVTPENIEPVKKWLSNLAVRGLANPVITVTGSASGEDSHVAADAGLGTKSQSNQRLAVERAENIATALREELKDDASQRVFKDRQIPVKVAGGTEQVLSKYRISELEKFAEAHGYSTVRDMVVSYNKGEVSDESVNTHLDELLAKNRGAHVVISGELPVPIPSVVDAPPEEAANEPKPFEETVEDAASLAPWIALAGGLAAAGISAALSRMYRRRKDGSWIEIDITADNYPAPYREDFDIVND
jgi:hypothetical protein